METKPLISDYLVPPGHYVREALELYGMTQSELAERTGRPQQAVSEIINARKEITEETAFQLEAVLGVPAHIWLNLESVYRYGMERQNLEERLASQGNLAAEYPYAELARIGFVKVTRKKPERVKSLIEFFGVAHLGLVQINYAAAFRKALKKEPSPYCLAAWLRIGELMAEKITLPPYDKAELKRVAPNLRCSTRTENEINQVIQDVLRPAGVAFVNAPRLSKTYANGATFWHRNRPVVLLSIRGAYEDVFWYSLFHELGHVLLHERSATFIEGLGADSPEEREADKYACDTLIHPNDWQRFQRRGQFDPDAVMDFANLQQINPSIVAGRLMHDGDAFHTYPDLQSLRRRLSFGE